MHFFLGACFIHICSLTDFKVNINAHTFAVLYTQVSCNLVYGRSKHMAQGVVTNRTKEPYHALYDITENQFLELIFTACKRSTDYSVV